VCKSPCLPRTAWPALLLAVVAPLCFGGHAAEAEDDLTVLGKDANRLLYTLLLERSAAIYQERDREVRAALQSAESVMRRARRLRPHYLRNLGDLPAEKCPLHARITGRVDAGEVRIENVVFESRPGFRVTANVYVPGQGPGPFPGVLIPCGHSPNGKIGYHPVGVLFARHGFVAIIYDPVCQGEREQIPNVSCTAGHSMLLPGSVLVGRTVQGYQAWDGIRALDYLMTRDDVDKTKPVGITGNSGGGCQTNFLMALDERIGPAAPSCYVMRKQRKFITLGPGDGCQWMPNEVRHGIDHADMAWIRAPRPTLILAAKRDFVDFRSTTEVAGELQQLYAAIGAPDQTGLFSHDDKHGFSKPRREAAAAWMQRWLRDDDSPVVEGEWKPVPVDKLVVTKSGQLLKEYEDERSVMQLNRARARELAAARARFWQQDPTQALAAVRQLIGSRKTAAEPARAASQGTIVRDGYRIEKLVISGPDQLPMPGLLFVPDQMNERCDAHLCVSDRGKSDGHVLKMIEKRVRSGDLVLSVDLRGYGETSDRMCKRKKLGRQYGIAALSLQLGTPLLGQRVDDILAAADVILQRPGITSLGLIGIGKTGPVALHAAALDARFTSLTLENAIQSWTDAIQDDPDYGYMVFGALRNYDLPDLVRCIAPRVVAQTHRKGRGRD
jgi:cephalosporin-C deacetylase-like acetyl esterase